MASDPTGERDFLRRALGPGKDCLAVEQLEACLQMGAAPDQLKHLDSCAYCQSELELLRSFYEAPRDDAEAEAVRQITERLSSPRVASAAARKSWWQSLFGAGWFRPAVVLAAAALIIAGVGLELRRRTAPGLLVPPGPEANVMRSGKLNLVSPVGDIPNVPARIDWSPVSGAARYTVRLLEVDHTELWNGETQESQLAIPASIREKIQPAKALLVQVTALDSTGRQLAESEFVRFRVLQKVYTR